MRAPEGYCASPSDPEACLFEDPEEPMPAEDVVANVFVTSITPTILGMYDVEWRTTTQIEGISLFMP